MINTNFIIYYQITVCPKLFGETEEYGYKKYWNDLSEEVQTQQASVSG